MDPIGKKLLDVAKAQLGYAEKGDGYTKFGDWYARNVDGDHDDYFKTAPWCDMFLAWAADKAGVTDQAGQFASTIDHAKWFRKQDAWGTEPQPGAFVFYDWSGSGDLDQIDHVGIVERVDGHTLHTIEGNADGYKLMRKTRDTDSVVGYGYPAKVRVEQKYAPKHAGPAPSVEQLAAPAAAGARARTHEQEPVKDAPPPVQEVVLGGVLAFVLCGTAALAAGRAGRAAAARTPTAPPIRVRKRGKHHRPATPVELPAELTPADLDLADAGTTIMPVLSLAAAHEAEDREFWGRIAHLEEDEELAFWDSLHAEAPASPSDECASTPGFR
ncbi:MULTISPECIES: CHAP domain-containing protein [Thermomonosporaceae]|uniref:CHAP domain-containing protein n=1 Tax=Thermomonosporaceae TaxID=2012 RepID=UPI00255B19E2|nr:MULTISPECIES: CHAP domain-containing protein [Thermomonosporaceae]MDL4774339.1 CHAP domain-containing protein [Actinomadura xylanilytica]